MLHTDIYTSEMINGYDTNVLTTLGNHLWETAQQTQLTMLLDVKEIVYEGYTIQFQKCNRYFGGGNGKYTPPTYYISISAVPEKKGNPIKQFLTNFNKLLWKL